MVHFQEKQAWFDSSATPIEIDSRDINVVVSGDFAVCHAILHINGTKEGADRRSNF
jgi:ketosteroid isomerase-like protein